MPDARNSSRGRTAAGSMASPIAATDARSGNAGSRSPAFAPPRPGRDLLPPVRGEEGAAPERGKADRDRRPRRAARQEAGAIPPPDPPRPRRGARGLPPDPLQLRRQEMAPRHHQPRPPEEDEIQAAAEGKGEIGHRRPCHFANAKTLRQ